MTKIPLLDSVCRDNALNWKIEFSEASGHYELHVFGIGKGENFYIKKTTDVDHGIAYIFDMMRASGINFRNVPT